MKRMLVTAAAILGLAGTVPAHARVDINIGIGVPGVIYTTPNHPRRDHYQRPSHPHSPRVIITQPRVIVVPGDYDWHNARDYDRSYRRDWHQGPRHKHKHHHHRRGKHRD